MQYLHNNCYGLIKNCPNNDEVFCGRCGKWVNESAIIEGSLEQGSSKMTQSSDFELTNCPDSNCYICNMKGYPNASQKDEDGRLKINAYHTKQAIDGMTALLDLIGRAA